MLIGQVLEADSDEPPNIRTFLLLLVISVSINNATSAVINNGGEKHDNNIVHLETGDEVVEAASGGTRQILARNEELLEQSVEGSLHFSYQYLV